ncbi:hypothetical protein [Pseudarthrobacter sp. fls2-241-R2A-168]|uniref:LGFP repeat-containing protein n=1 Tax=Pseudarthrobacter sp. fls2-241-R2A-168 TaxID=3040304 RepID=UPI0025566049|nr:hypothetical protein [Pseudarthrobacter sp. fls2-241-R2A-168]
MGPIDPNHGYPAWFSDGGNAAAGLGPLQLELCLDGPLCLATDFRPDPSKPMSFPDNFPDEAFWWAGDASIESGNISALLGMAQEAAFANGVPAAGDQVAFSRIRIRIDGLTANASYTITHPYGTIILPADSAGSINYTQDQGCFDTPCSEPAFARAATGTIGPFLRWTSGAPDGYVGDPGVEHAVIGSPTGNNFFQVEGPGISPLRTDLFSIQGKIDTGQPSIVVQGSIAAKHAAVAALVGSPIANEVTGQRFGGGYQTFERGIIAYLPGSSAFAVTGGINTVWNSIGSQNSDLGYPTSDEYSPMAGGVIQNFQFGKISWNPVTGSRITKGGIGVTWDSVGGPLSGLGYPTTDEYTTANGGVAQKFQYGQIVWSPASGSRFIKGGIGATWINAGGSDSQLGYPTSDEIGGLVRGGAKQQFQGGEVIWSPAAGARVVIGGIRSAWVAQGSEGGRLGYPTSNEYPVSGGGYAQDYEGGRITWRLGSLSVAYAN